MIKYQNHLKFFFFNKHFFFLIKLFLLYVKKCNLSNLQYKIVKVFFKYKSKYILFKPKFEKLFYILFLILLNSNKV